MQGKVNVSDDAVHMIGCRNVGFYNLTSPLVGH